MLKAEDAPIELISYRKDQLTRIAGLIVMSDNPCQELKIWREKYGINQFAICDKMGITYQTLWQYETCKRKVPGAKFVKRFVIALGEMTALDKHNFAE